MTHFVRFAMISAIVAGASICAIAQDDDSLDALLEGLVDETVLDEAAPEAEEAVEEIADTPAEEVAAEAEAVAEADESDALPEEEVAAEDVAEVPAEEPAPEAEDVADAAEPAETEVEAVADAEEVAEEDVADVPAEEPAPEAEDVAEAAEPTETEVEAVAEAEEPAEEVAEEEVAEAPAEEAAEEEVADVPAEEPAPEAEEVADAAEPAETEVEAVAEAEEPAEEVAEEEVAEAPAEEAAEEEVAEEPAEEPAAEAVAEDAEPTETEVEAVAEAEEPAEEVAEEEVAEAPAEEPTEEAVAADEPAEDDSLESLLGDLADEETPAEEVAAETVADEEPAEAPAEEVAEVTEEDTPAIAEEEPAEAPAEEAVAETPAEAPAVAEAVVEDVPAAPEASAEDVPEVASGEALIAEVSPEEVTQVEELTEEERKYNDLALLMELKNRGLDNHANACLMKARQLMTTPPASGKAFEQYADAIKMYKDAQKYFRQREENLPLRSECEIGIREAEYRQAKVRFEEGDFKTALEMAQAVQLSGHTQGAALIAVIQEEMNKPADIRPTPVLPEYAKDKYKMDRLAIQERMRRATVYFQLAKYKDANDQLELILRNDPNNEEAINLRARVNRRHADRNRQLKYSTHDEMISQVELNWTPLGALGRNSEELYTPTESKGATTKINKEGEKDAAVVMAKLQYIRLPEFTIRPPSTLADAVSLFAELAKAYDKPELPPEEKGVAFVLNMGKPAAAAAATSEEEDPFASDDSSSDSGLPPIAAISMPWVTLKEALDMVCEVTGSKYVIKGKTVVIVPATYVAGEMVTRSYNVMAGLMEKLGAVNAEMGSSSDSGDGWEMDSGSLSTGSTDGDTLKRIFSELGVPFEGNAKIAYLPTIGKLRVTNTSENLAILEGILEDLNVTPSQIEVEARFVEVSQADLNSLGFEWRLNSDIVGTVGSGIDWAESAIQNNSYSGSGAGGLNAQSRPVFNGPGGTGDANVAVHGGQLNNGMRFLGDGAAYANRINLASSTVAPDDTFASFSAVFGKVDMTMILHMLAQRTDTDMLSSPKVLARPGQEALIRVVTEHIYPTEFDITELEEAEQNWNNGGGNTNLGVGGGNAMPQMNAPPVKFAVEPQSFETKDVGVSLQVVPELSQEGQMINMLVNPKVVEYLGDFDYGMKVPYIQYGLNPITGGVSSAEVEYYNVEMPQPKFHVREINTYISVYNGSTVVMGGLITETRKSFEDKVPFLGDLPFIGFLFRSKGEYSEKRNLLVFLTARLVDPAGRPLKTATDGRTSSVTMDSASAETMGATTQE